MQVSVAVKMESQSINLDLDRRFATQLVNALYPRDITKEMTATLRQWIVKELHREALYV